MGNNRRADAGLRPLCGNFGWQLAAADSRQQSCPVEGPLQRASDVHRCSCRSVSREDSGIKILVHPECPREVNDIADVSGSTSKIIQTVQQSPAELNGR